VDTSVPRGLVHGEWPVKALLGDWSRWIRDWVDLVRLSYLAAGVYCFLAGMTGHGVRMLVTFAVTLAPRALKVPRPFDLFFTVTIGLQAWGNMLGAFHGGDSFDRVDHACSTLGLAPLFYLWFVRLGLVQHVTGRKSRARHLGLVVIGFCIGLSVGALYEIYEYVAVHAFGAHIFINETDTVMDLVMDSVGSAAGSLLLLAWLLWGWGTERRVPAADDRPAARS
jgi:hypothetical protein